MLARATRPIEEVSGLQLGRRSVTTPRPSKQQRRRIPQVRGIRSARITTAAAAIVRARAEQSFFRGVEPERRGSHTGVARARWELQR